MRQFGDCLGRLIKPFRRAPREAEGPRGLLTEKPLAVILTQTPGQSSPTIRVEN